MSIKKKRKTEKPQDSGVDSRGVRYDAAFYPHDILCIRRGASLTNPQPCNCGGDDLV